MKQLLYKLSAQAIQKSTWWVRYVDGDPYKAKFICVKLGEDGLGLYQQTTGREPIRMYQRDMILVVTKEEEIRMRINKLYAKCKTTAHWSK